MNFIEVNLGELCQFVRGLTYSKSDEVVFSRNVVLRATNIDLETYKLDLSSLRYIDDSVIVKEEKKLRKNDILICTASGSKSHLGKVALVDDDLGMAFGGFMGVLRVKSNNLLPAYLYKILSSNIFVNHVNRLSSGSNINNLKFSQIEDFKVPMPSFELQEKIVKKIDLIQAEIDKAKSALDLNILNSESIFKNGLISIFRNSDGWTSSSIGDVLSVIKNGINCDQSKDTIGSKITRIETISNKFFDYSRVGYAVLNDLEKQKSKLKVGDILFSHINSPIHVGKSAIYLGEEEIYHGINLLLMRTIDDVNPYFFNFFLNYLFNSGYWEWNCKKSVNQASVNQKDINKVEFKYPSIEVQKDIVLKLNNLYEQSIILKKAYTEKNNELIKLKNLIFKKAFLGELVKD